MKKVISIVLTLIVFLSMIALPFSVYASKDAAQPAKVTDLIITTENKKGQLKLTWKIQNIVDGYQIYRSTTGKSGTYKRIVTVRNKNTYVDKELKSATTYYYKVRAFSKQNEKTVFGPLAKIDLSTRITSGYVKKRFNATIKFLEDFYSSGTNFDQMILQPHTDAYGTYDDPHYLFEYKGCRTKAQLKQQLTKYVSSKVANAILKEKFLTIDGKLYIWFPPMGAESAMVLSKTRVSKLVCSDRKATMRIGAFWEGAKGYGGADYDYFNQTLVYENGRWVFGQKNYMMDWIYPYW